MLIILFLGFTAMIYMRPKTPKAKVKLDSSECDPRKHFNKIGCCPMGNAEEREEISAI